MLLKEFLETVPDNAQLSIGSKCSYIFIGKKSEFYEDVKLIENELIDTAKKSLSSFRIQKRLIVDPESSAHRFRKDFKGKLVGISSSERDALIKKLSEKIQIKEEYIADFPSLLEREIKDIYPKPCSSGIAIIIEGVENGAFWVKEEYDRKYRGSEHGNESSRVKSENSRAECKD